MLINTFKNKNDTRYYFYNFREKLRLGKVVLIGLSNNPLGVIRSQSNFCYAGKNKIFFCKEL